MSAAAAGIEARGLARVYGNGRGVGPLDLVVEAGERFGLVGPNGAGKSTTLDMLTTLLPPTSGSATVGGADLRDVTLVRARIGVVFQAPSLDLRLSALENLDFFAALHRPAWSAAERERRILEALDRMGLADRATEDVGGFSWGMRRRVEVARALLTEPRVLFLDEPTTGLDPQTRASVWAHLDALPDLTLVVATHDMEEAARCDRLGVLRAGRLVAVDTPAALVARTGAPTLTEAFLRLTGVEVAAERPSVDGAFRARAAGRETRSS